MVCEKVCNDEGGGGDNDDDERAKTARRKERQQCPFRLFSLPPGRLCAWKPAPFRSWAVAEAAFHANVRVAHLKGRAHQLCVGGDEKQSFFFFKKQKSEEDGQISLKSVFLFFSSPPA